MSTGEPHTRHRVFPPQRMHTRSRSTVSTETITGSRTVRSDAALSPQSTHKKKKGTNTNVNGTNSKLFSCHTCGKSFKSLGGLRKHHVTHMRKKVYRCRKCPQVFTLEVQLAQHVRTSHSSTRSGDRGEVPVHNMETVPVTLLECPPQVNRLQDCRENNIYINVIKEATSIQKHVNKNSISEFQLEQKSKEVSSMNNAAQRKGYNKLSRAQQEFSIIAEVKSDQLLGQVLEHCLTADESQASDVRVKEVGTSQSSSTLGLIGRNQELTDTVTADNETFVVVKQGNNITDILLQDDGFKLSGQQTLTPSNSQIAEQTTYTKMKAGISLLSTRQPDRVQTSNTDKLVNYSKELVSSGQTVNTPTSGQTVDTPTSGQTVDTPTSGQTANTPSSGQTDNTPISGQTVNTPVHSNVISGITTIGHLKAAPDTPNYSGEENAKLAQLSDKHVRIKSHFSKEDIDEEVTDDPVLGLVSGLVKFCPDLSETDYTEVAKVTGVTVIMLDKQKIVVHGSWKSLNRAYSMIENLQMDAKKERTLSTLRECIAVTSPLECDAVSSPLECVAVTSPVECITVASSLDKVKQDGVESGVIVADDPDPEVTIETSNSVDLEKLTMMEPETLLCDKCSKLFWSRRSLQEHIALRHTEHKCKMCHKVFSERRYLQTHLKRHANIRNYSCSICGWKFMERFKMKLHMESHKELKDRRLPYKCTMCGNQFYNRASWSDHLNTHTGNRPYSCMLCSNTFAHRIGLKRHMVTHLKDKPYKCGQCGRSFSFRSKLADHMTMHTGIGKHKCSDCGKIFTASSSLRRHMEQCTVLSNPPGPEKPAAMEMTVDVIQATESDTIYMCGICAETFDSLVKAEKHTIDHEQSVEDGTIVIQENQQVVFTDNVAIVSDPRS